MEWQLQLQRWWQQQHRELQQTLFQSQMRSIKVFVLMIISTSVEMPHLKSRLLINGGGFLGDERSHLAQPLLMMLQFP